MSKEVEKMEVAEVVTITKTEFNKFRTSYNNAGKAMFKVCKQAYELCEKDEKGFKKMCAEEMNLPAHTITKLKVAGEIAHNANFLLPESYSNIYELAPVREQLDEFGDYIDENEIDLTKETQANTRKIVKDYLSGGEEEEVEEEEVEEEEVEEVDVKNEDKERIISSLEQYQALLKNEEEKSYIGSVIADIIKCWV